MAGSRTHDKNSEVPKGKKTPEVKEIEKDIGTYSDLKALSESAGGKILVDNLARDLIAGIDVLGQTFRTATHAELMAICADMESKLTILRLITRAKKNKELAEEALRKEIMRDPEADG